MNLAKLLPAAPSPIRIALRLSCCLLLGLSLVLGAPSAWAKPKVHTVYAGQRLGSIAKRYNVTVDELCRANGISPKSPIHPGQKLVIPGTDDGQGAESKSPKRGEKSKKEEVVAKPSGKTRVHVVAKGHTLSAIAGRYAITVSSLCYANDMPRDATLEVGQKLIVPHKTDKGGAYARKQRDRGDFSEQERHDDDEKDADSRRPTSNPAVKTWTPYLKPAWRKGYIKMRRYGRYWEGYVIGPKGEVLGHASNKINFVLGARDDGPRIDSKLIRLIASISDTFGGRELRIVSGYRTKSFVAASQHKKGKALDFSIPGVPNEALRDYLRTIDDVGVGYYPNSSFVHVDVRGYNSYWIDYAGPGEAPRKSGKKKKSRKLKDVQEHSDQEDHDHGDDDQSGDEQADDDGEQVDEDDEKADEGDESRHSDDPAPKEDSSAKKGKTEAGSSAEKDTKSSED